MALSCVQASFRWRFRACKLKLSLISVPYAIRLLSCSSKSELGPRTSVGAHVDVCVCVCERARAAAQLSFTTKIRRESAHHGLLSTHTSTCAHTHMHTRANTHTLTFEHPVSDDR